MWGHVDDASSLSTWVTLVLLLLLVHNYGLDLQVRGRHSARGAISIQLLDLHPPIGARGVVQGGDVLEFDDVVPGAESQLPGLVIGDEGKERHGRVVLRRRGGSRQLCGYLQWGG